MSNANQDIVIKPPVDFDRSKELTRSKQDKEEEQQKRHKASLKRKQVINTRSTPVLF